MIPERYIKQARRLDNGEIVRGYYLNYLNEHFIVSHENICWEPNEYTDIKTLTWCCFPSDLCRIDPATVEDVAAKPITGENGNIYFYCPNCNNEVGAFIGRNYCPDCGQRLEL